MQSNLHNGIPKLGVGLKNRSDIETFDSSKKYEKGTMVKFKSLDGEYILGEADKSAPCAEGVSAFKAYDKSSYKEHNSPKDAIKVNEARGEYNGTIDLIKLIRVNIF